MFNFAICDDEPSFCAKEKAVIAEFFERQNLSVNVDIYLSGRELMALDGRVADYDAVFLDACMEQVNGIDLAESTICTYPNAEDSGEKTWYITCYTEQGIVCRGGKAGEMETLWSIEFTKDGQYKKVMDFLKQFPTEWNLRFAVHEVNCRKKS